MLNKIEMEGYSVGAPALHGALAYVRVTGGKVARRRPREPQRPMELDDLDVVVRADERRRRGRHDLRGERVLPRRVRRRDRRRAALADAGAARAFDASPIIVGGYVVAASTDRTLYLVDRKTGAKVKEFVVGETMIGTPAIVDGIAYVPGASGTLFAVE